MKLILAIMSKIKAFVIKDKFLRGGPEAVMS
jgi:hypothetical protein